MNILLLLILFTTRVVLSDTGDTQCQLQLASKIYLMMGKENLDSGLFKKYFLGKPKKIKDKNYIGLVTEYLSPFFFITLPLEMAATAIQNYYAYKMNNKEKAKYAKMVAPIKNHPRKDEAIDMAKRLGLLFDLKSEIGEYGYWFEMFSKDTDTFRRAKNYQRDPSRMLYNTLVNLMVKNPGYFCKKTYTQLVEEFSYKNRAKWMWKYRGNYIQ